MSKVIFNYGVMNSSKTAQLLMTNYNYISSGRTTVLIKPAMEDRSGKRVIASRVGIKDNADILIDANETNRALIKKELLKAVYLTDDVESNVGAILVDEAQFFSKDTIKTLVRVSRDLEIQIMFYGLLKNFQNELFEGSKALIESADSIIEIKTTCIKCERKATCNIRLVNGSPVYDGDEVEIGGNESYVSVCAHHYYNFEN